ncbi:XdhC family protein [Peribacillus sp. SCS-155]|uniref:XdhC family protein n=1 Tax=Peribacillus sedimenti TaxID=3115297 RepID=UPI0039063CE0
MHKVILGLKKCLDEQKPAALATIIRTEGSTYQPSGTRCLIMEDGQVEGLVSGGCVESDLAGRIQEVIKSFKPETIIYDFRNENDFLWGMGLGCDGAITLFLQPFDPVHHLMDALALYDQLITNYDTNTLITVATVIHSSNETLVPPGSFRVLEHQSILTDSSSSAYCKDLLLDGVVAECFVEHIKPRQHVAIFGAGPDVTPVVNQLAAINWRISVIDHRPNYAQTNRFPKADEVLLVNRTGYNTLCLSKNTYCLIMTHNYELDLQLLGELLEAKMPYIGILGAAKRMQKMKIDLLEYGVTLEEGKVHSPIGLDIGASTPEEIAVSIAAELLAFNRGQKANSRVVEAVHPDGAACP